jgi:nucleoside phosphorylase
MADALRKLTHRDYTVGWICALPDPEMVVAQAMLDEEHEILPVADPGDTNTYLLGRIGSHNVVVACLPSGITGIGPAAIVAKDMMRSFKSISFGLMVGIGGGVGPPFADIRLGDIVVSQHSKKSAAVVQYDFGTSEGGQFICTKTLNKPPDVVLTAVSRIRSQHGLKDHNLARHLSAMVKNYPKLAPSYQHQGVSNDHLFKADYIHVNSNESCDDCCSILVENTVPREPRVNDSPVIHYGTIGSANKVMRDSILRDKWAKEQNIICYEMEAAGSCF